MSENTNGPTQEMNVECDEGNQLVEKFIQSPNELEESEKNVPNDKIPLQVFVKYMFIFLY